MKTTSLLAFALACSTGFFAFEYFRLITSQQESQAQTSGSGYEEPTSPKSAKEQREQIVEIDHHVQKQQQAQDSSTNGIHHIKQKLCINGLKERDCAIDTELDLADLIFDEELLAVKSQETVIVLGSMNYSDVMPNIMGTNSENIMKSERLNQRAIALAKGIDPRIESSFFCNPNLCLASVRTYSEQNWQDFQEKFFTGEAAGSLFILPDPHEEHAYRLLVAFGDGLAVKGKKN